MNPTEEAARLLIDVARTGRLSGLPPHLVPADDAAAYRVQDLVIGDVPIAGWKVTPTAPFLCAAIPANRYLRSGDHLSADLIPPEVEVEIAVIVASDLPLRERPYDEAEVVAALGGLCVAFELVQSRFVDRKAVSKLTALADALSNGAFACGKEVGERATDWNWLPLDSVQARLILAGETIATKSEGPSRAQTIAALVWLANHASRRGVGLKKGQAIITGARIGPLSVEGRGLLRAEIDGLGAAELTIGHRA